MKKILSFVLAIALLVPVFANTLVYAKNADVCNVNGASHDYSYSWSLLEAHPHAGHVECECGDIIYSDKMIEEECETCRKLLCEMGIHYYLASVYIKNALTGKCYCGKTKAINSTESEFISHLEHNEQGYWLSSCEFCNMNDEYYEDYFNFVVSFAIENQSNGNYNDYDDHDNYEDGYYEPETSVTHTGNSHDLHPAIIQNYSHPHKGYLECSCGLRSYFENSIHSECLECRDEPCYNGIHYYSYDIYYRYNTVYAACFCGQTVSVDCTYNEYNEHLNHTNNVYISCPICMLELECSSSYYDYVIARALSNWEQPIPDEIYYAEAEVTTHTVNDPEQERHSINSYNCSVTAGEHDFTAGGSYSTDHPHAGYYTCWCGEELHYVSSFLEECTICRNELCNSGIHDFSYALNYTDSTKKFGYGSCYCGATMNFTEAISKYNAIGLTLILEDYKAPCASCTFKAILSNELTAFQSSRQQNFDEIAKIYSGYDITYAYNHYADVASHKYNWNCTHSDCYLENKPVVVTPPSVQQQPVVTPSTNSTHTNNNSSITKPVEKEEETIELDPYYMYELPEMINMIPATIEDAETADAFQDFLDQFFLGNYAEKVTPAGTIGEIVFSLTGLDAYKDVSDLWYNLTHWENSWGHLGTTLLSAIAIFPIIGGFKSADEVALLNKVAKMDPDTLNILKKIGGVNANALIKLKKMTSSDLLKLLKSRGHALTKHVDKTSLDALQLLRKKTYGKTFKGAISSFYTQDEAVQFIHEAIQNDDVVAIIAHQLTLNTSSEFAVDIDLGKVTGAILRENSDEITKATGIRIVIKPQSSSEFYIKSAFPV